MKHLWCQSQSHIIRIQRFWILGWICQFLSRCFVAFFVAAAQLAAGFAVVSSAESVTTNCVLRAVFVRFD